MPYLLKKMKILDLAGSWWPWKWFLAIEVTRELFNLDFETGADGMSIKGLLLLWSGIVGVLIKGLLLL